MTNPKTLFNLKKSLIAIVVGFIIAFAIAAIVDPSVFLGLLGAVFFEPLALDQIAKVGTLASILIIVSLGMSVSFKAKLFNIGIPGQMLAGAIVPSMLASTVAANGYFPGAWILMLVIGVFFGALAGGLAGWLKARFKVHEVISTIMFNWIIYYIGKTIFTMDPYVKPGFPGSKPWHPSLRVNVYVCMAIALILIGAIWYLFNKTKMGYKLTMVGQQASVARYAGYNETKIQIFTLALSGALAGLGGVLYSGTYNGWYSLPIFDSLDPTGFNAIIIALVAFNSPILIGFISTLFAIIYIGANIGSVLFKYAGPLMSLAFGLMMMIMALSDNIKYKDIKITKKKTKKEGGK